MNCGLVLTLSLCCLFTAGLGQAVNITWTNKLTTGSWGTNAVWDTYPALPAFDGTEDVALGAATMATSTYALNGNRFVNSVSVAGTQKMALPGLVWENALVDVDCAA